MQRMTGTIIRLSTPGTVVVSVERSWLHPVYQKAVKRTKSYACTMTADQTMKIGDQVLIENCRPVSKTKRFRIVEKVARS